MRLLTSACLYLQVSQIIAPAVLAVYALNLSRISVLDTATLLFGYFLAEKLEPPSLFWGFIATLVAAVYYGYGKVHQSCSLSWQGVALIKKAPAQTGAQECYTVRGPEVPEPVWTFQCAL